LHAVERSCLPPQAAAGKRDSLLPEPALVYLLAALVALAGCSDPDADGRFEMTRVESTWTNGRLNVISEQRLTLSDEARNALIHGVPLTLELDLVLRNSSNQTRTGQNKSSYEIRYLPLSDYYQLAFRENDTVMTFPRLRHVLAELSRLNVSVETGVVPAGDYELLARMTLDQHKMPPPMRLPVLLSAEWRHDSSWTSWPLQIDPGK
jgi:hypothetical protein